MEISHSENVYRDKALEEFHQGVSELDLELSAAKDKQQPITLGPLYHVASSQGEPLNVYTLSIDYSPLTDPLTPKDDRYKLLYMIAYDEMDNMVGLRRTILSEDWGVLKGFGYITTFPRERGITSSIELVHEDFLQRVADDTGRDGLTLEYHMVNGNLAGLDYLKRKSQTSELITGKENEQSRWQRLYGSNGTLGYDNNGIKQFTAHQKQTTTPIDSIDTIALGRIVSSENGRRMIRGEVQDIRTMDITELSQIRQQRFTGKIIPSVQSALKAA